LNQRYKDNYKRDCSCCFGYDAVTDFLETNKLVSVVRAHEVKQDGFEEHWYKNFNPDLKVPPVITIFSAPNYCDQYANSGSYMHVEDDIYVIHQFNWVDHPNVHPHKYKNGINFSLPFVMEKIIGVIFAVLQVLSRVEQEEEAKLEKEEQQLQKPSRSLAGVGTKVFDLLKAKRSMLSLQSLRKEYEKEIAPLAIDSKSVDFRGLGLSRSLSAMPSTRAPSKAKKSWFAAVEELDKENEKLVYLTPSPMANTFRLRRTQTFRL